MSGAWPTMSVKLWVVVPVPLVAVMVSGDVPPAVAGVPDRVAVPLPLSTKVTPVGRVRSRQAVPGSRWWSPGR